MALKVLSLYAVLAYIFIVVHALPKHHYIQKRSGMKLCGRNLVDALAIVCHNEYYDPDNIVTERASKRSGYTVDSYPPWETSVLDGDGFLDTQTALAFLARGQLPRGVRGVADECCRKTCSYSQLASYCGTGANTNSLKK